MRPWTAGRTSRAAIALAFAGALTASPHVSAADGGDAGALSPAWPIGAFILDVAGTVGAVAGAGWPVDDASARIAAGAAAGMLPSAGILALWGAPCRDGGYRRERALCWLESIAQGLVVAGADAAAMYFTMRYVMPFPDGVRPSVETAAAWASGWVGGTGLLLILPPVVGADWGDDFWSTAGLFAWVHVAAATALLGVLYALESPRAEENWTVRLELPVAF